jgi:hypothetical protein
LLFAVFEFADGSVHVGLLAVFEGGDEAVLELAADFAFGS